MLFRGFRVRSSFLLLAAFALTAATPSVEPRAKLIVFIVVDQLAIDTLKRIRPSLKGGLAQLLRQGVFFTDAHHEHLVTETCPGHATLATGDFPAHTGIVGNQFYDRGKAKEVTCTEDSEFGDSPRALLVDTLGDWLKSATSESRVYSVSSKTRAAVMLGGMRADAAYWYEPASGNFVTSAYYPSAARTLIADWNAQQMARSYYGSIWEPLTPDWQIPAAFDLSKTREGMASGMFPYRFGTRGGAPDGEFFDSLNRSPKIDHMVSSVARFLVERENLGRHSKTDMLGISYSALDYVGHRYGPNSPEVFDVLIRLDRELQELFKVLEQRVGSGKILTVLSADHGIPPLPEHLRLKGIMAERQNAAGIACMQNVRFKLQEKYRVSFGAQFSLTNQSLKELGKLRPEYDRMLKQELEQCRGIARVWTEADLNVPGDSIEKERARNSFNASRGDDFLIQFARNFATHPLHGVNHGTPYEYDTHVPLIIAGAGLPAREVSAPMRTVDVALTIAGLLGIPVPADRDGRNRADLLSQP